MVKECFQGRVLHSVDHVLAIASCQQFDGIFFGDAATPEVEDSLFFQLSDCCAVCAAYIVCIDLQLWLGVDMCVGAEQKILVQLVGICFLCRLAHKNLPIEYAARGVIQQAFV